MSRIFLTTYGLVGIFKCAECLFGDGNNVEFACLSVDVYLERMRDRNRLSKYIIIYMSLHLYICYAHINALSMKFNFDSKIFPHMDAKIYIKSAFALAFSIA